MAQNGRDFRLPDEILAVIPGDPFDQLDLARKITSMAIASRVSKLELENGKLRQAAAEKDRVIGELEGKVAQLSGPFQDLDARLRESLEENAKLIKERDALAMTVKKLSRDLSKLESFKKHLIQSLKEDNSSHPTEKIDGSCDQSVPNAPLLKGETPIGNNMSNIVIVSAETGSTLQTAQTNVREKFWPTPYITPRLTPTATPQAISISNSPRGYSAAGSPKQTSRAMSPTKIRTEGLIAASPWYPSSQRSSAANSPTRVRNIPGRTPRIDGKEFFRQARNRLSYEQFAAFLANIKELNAHRQSREETLKKAEDIFGTDNRELYFSFLGLLNRNLP